jgi:hypothetical protein
MRVIFIQGGGGNGRASAASISRAVIQVLDDFVLKGDDAFGVPPPVVDAIFERGQRHDMDANPLRGGLLVEDPVHPAAGKDLGRDDDVLDAVLLAPLDERARLLESVGNVGPERPDRLGRDAELEENGAVELDMEGKMASLSVGLSLTPARTIRFAIPRL